MRATTTKRRSTLSRALDQLGDKSTPMRWYERLMTPVSRVSLALSLGLLAVAIAMRGFFFRPAHWELGALVGADWLNGGLGAIGLGALVFRWFRIAVGRHQLSLSEEAKDQAGQIPDRLRQSRFPDEVGRAGRRVGRGADEVRRGCLPQVVAVVAFGAAATVLAATVGPAPLRALPLTAATSGAGQSSSSGGQSRVTLVNDNGSLANPPIQWTITYPQLQHAPNASAQSAINQTLKNYPENAKAQYISFVAGLPSQGGATPSNPAIVTLKATPYVTPDLLSVLFSGYQNTPGAAHPDDLLQAYNYDLTSGTLLTARMLVAGQPGSAEQQQHLDALLAVLEQTANQQLAQSGGACTVTTDALLGGGPDKPFPLTFSAKGLEADYNTYTFGARPCEFFTTIPYSQLTGLLNPTYFPGQ